MATTYIKTDNPTATYGENSPSVLALQKELNTKYNAGLALDSKYGPLTQAAYTKYMGGSSTPAPTPTPTTPNIDPNRLVRTANPNDAEISKIERQIRNYTLNEPDLGKITAEKRRGAKAVIDAVTAQFNKTLEAQGVVNRGLNDRVRALNVSSGLGGSDFASAAAIGQEEKNEKANQMIRDERDAKINAILAGVDERASEEYQKRREEYVKSMGEDLTRRKQAKEEDRKKATETITGLAAQGVSIDKLKEVDQKTYDLLLKEYGGNQLDLETAWNASLPENMKVQYGQVTKKGNNGNAFVIRYGLNPVTGKTESKEYDMGIKYGDFVGKGETELKEIDGRLWSVSYDEDGNQVAKPLTEISELTRSQINENNASAYKSRKEADGGGSSGFKFSGTQRTKLINANFNDAKINAIEADLKEYGVKAVLDGLSTDEEKNAVSESLKGTDLASQLMEYAKSNQ